MLDNRYNEHEDYDSEIFLQERGVGAVFDAIGHMFTYVGIRSFGNEMLNDSYKAKVYVVKDNAGNVVQNIGVITDTVESPELLDGHFQMGLEVGELFPIESFDPLIIVEKTIDEHKWGEIEPTAHVSRIGGQPSFGDGEDYGQPYTQNPDGNLVPIPFLGQHILPDGRYVHAYHVRGWDDPVDGAGDPDDFDWDDLNGSVVIIQDETPSENVTLKLDSPRYALSETAYATVSGKYPTFAYYYQGSEVTEEYPYTLFHFPGSSPYGDNIPKYMASYTDVYLIWNGTSKGMLVEQYD